MVSETQHAMATAHVLLVRPLLMEFGIYEELHGDASAFS